MTWEQFSEKYPAIMEAMRAFGMSKEQYLLGAMKLLEARAISSGTTEQTVIPVHENELLDALDRFSRTLSR